MLVALVERKGAHRSALDLDALHVVARVLARPRVLELDKGESARLLRVVVAGNVDIAHLAEALGNLPEVIRPTGDAKGRVSNYV